MGRVARIPIPDFSRRDGCHDGAVNWLGCRAVFHRQIDELKNWPARAWLRYAKPFEEKRHAHHGRGVDFVRYWRIDLVVV